MADIVRRKEPAMSEITITLDDNIERQAAEILDRIGMSLSD